MWVSVIIVSLTQYFCVEESLLYIIILLAQVLYTALANGLFIADLLPPHQSPF